MKFFEHAVFYIFKFFVKLLRRLHPEWKSRNWSNMELRRYGHLLTGDVINVSGWDDRDKYSEPQCQDHKMTKLRWINVSGD
jgi:hypothetical protein